jgi:hypothetical protein
MAKVKQKSASKKVHFGMTMNIIDNHFFKKNAKKVPSQWEANLCPFWSFLTSMR